MPQAGVPARARRRYAAPWWEELDREAFRFPAAYEVKPAARTANGRVSARVAGPSSPPRPVAAAPAPPAAAPTPAPGPAPAPAPASAPTRRTVTIRGYGAERNLPVARPTLRRHERPGFRPDRAALWAFFLGLVLILVAVASAHG
jgi:hypothetical protein